MRKPQKVVAIIQARMGSTRLPGKVMLNLCGKTVLGHVIERVKQSKRINEIVIATTTHTRDDCIVDEAKKHSVKFFRGSEDDVLSRYYNAGKEIKADIVVRITSDCPVIDTIIIDKMVGKFLNLFKNNKIDYMSNTLNRTFPRGLDAEIISFLVLEKIFKEAQKQHEREHVTPYIYQNPHKFKLVGFKNEINYSCYRWTLDTPEDLNVITMIYKYLYSEKKVFWLDDIIDFIKTHPEIHDINKHVEQKKLDQYTFRETTEYDCDLLFEWSNDKLVRENSFNGEKIKYSEHIIWFEEKLKSDDSFMYIFQVDSKDVGLIRLDKIDSNIFSINYSISKDDRGKGYGTALLGFIRGKYSSNLLIGKVKSSNVASIKAFIKAGYIVKDESDIKVFYSFDKN